MFDNDKPLTQRIVASDEDSAEKEPQHVDDFINYGSKIGREPVENEYYARWVLHHFRLPALMMNAFEEFMSDNLLFCDYEGEQYKVIGASRMGDVWLTKDFSRRHGYDARVLVERCSNWKKKADE